MEVLVEQRGVTFTLQHPPLAMGGEAYLYAVPGDDTLVAKIYHKENPERADKLAAMIANPPVDPMQGSGQVSIAWPLDRLFVTTASQRCVGFVMPRIANTFSIFNYYNPKTRRQTCPMFDYRYLIRTARNLASAFSSLHAAGYVVGDVNESNILASESALITLVDTDSFQVPKGDGVYRCPVGKPEFTPPELQGVHFRAVDRYPTHDAFGLAVVIFLLLMEGTHPFAGRHVSGGEPIPLANRIAANYYPYHSSDEVPYEPMPLAPPIGMLHPELRALFRQCFETGHKTPAIRPSAASWQKALEVAEGNLRVCRMNTQHFYRFGYGSCPWCERAKLMGGIDPYPSRKAIDRAEHTQTFHSLVADAEAEEAEVEPAAPIPDTVP